MLPQPWLNPPWYTGFRKVLACRSQKTFLSLLDPARYDLDVLQSAAMHLEVPK
jgi:hypothetical protein